MNKQKQYDFGKLVIERLGQLVEEMKQLGLANGVREEEIKQVWFTAFQILSHKAKISRARLSQRLRHKRKQFHE